MLYAFAYWLFCKLCRHIRCISTMQLYGGRYFRSVCIQQLEELGGILLPSPQENVVEFDALRWLLRHIIYLCPSGHYKIFHHSNYRFVQPDKNMQARQNVILCHLVVLNLWATYTLGTLRYWTMLHAARPMVKSVLASWKCSFADCTSVVIGLPSPYSYLLQYYIQLTIVLHKQINGGGVGGGL